MRNKAPKLAMLMRRLLEAVKDVNRAVQNQTEAINAGGENRDAKANIPTEVRCEVRFDQQTVAQNRAEQDRNHRTQNSVRKAAWAAFIAASIYSIIAACQLHEMQKATRATQDAANAAKDGVTVAEKSIGATIDNFHLDQRAWVGVTQFGSSSATQNDAPYIEAGKEVRFIARFTNSGKTPAKTTRTDIAFQFLPKGVQLSPTLKEPNPPITASTFIVQPGATHFLQTLPTVFSAPQIVAATQGQLVLYVYGTIRYQDVFGKEHSTEFCAFITPSLKSFDGCPSYNDSD
jgi:hypothetical protein